MYVCFFFSLRPVSSKIARDNKSSFLSQEPDKKRTSTENSDVENVHNEYKKVRTGTFLSVFWAFCLRSQRFHMHRFLSRAWGVNNVGCCSRRRKIITNLATKRNFLWMENDMSIHAIWLPCMLWRDSGNKDTSWAKGWAAASCTGRYIYFSRLILSRSLIAIPSWSQSKSNKRFKVLEKLSVWCRALWCCTVWSAWPRVGHLVSIDAWHGPGGGFHNKFAPFSEI